MGEKGRGAFQIVSFRNEDFMMINDKQFMVDIAPVCACGVLRHCEVAPCITYAISVSSFLRNAGRYVG